MTTSPAGTEVSAPVRSRLRLWILGLLLLGAAAALVRYFGAEEGEGGAARRGAGGGFRRGGSDQPVPVRLVTAERRDIDVHLRALGTVTSLGTVTVRSRLDGELVRVLFTEGQHVSAGQLLAEIDPRPYEAQLAQALGQQAENRARLENARADLARLHKLVEEGLVTQQQVSSQESLVGQYQGALQSNEAQVKTARLNLAYTRIVAPISGRLGLRQVDPGNLVRAGDANGLVVITQMRPISVIFTVPEAELPAVLEATRAGRRLPVEAWDRADSVKLADGRLETVDNQIDTATGTIRLRATFDNVDQQLFPNQFVNVRLRVRTLEGATAIPAAAVQRASFGTFVYVVKPDETVTISRVTLGPQEGDRVAVAQGLEAGARVVIEGVDNLTEGARVEVIGEAPVRSSGTGAAAAGDGAAPGAGGRRP
jgi:multidrug efflux system membrane fusion protein